MFADQLWNKIYKWELFQPCKTILQMGISIKGKLQGLVGLVGLERGNRQKWYRRSRKNLLQCLI